mmetsp:Transcript_33698/g.56640  ORF Transcript_33698/g.56640 Transcript_33698/m.56640 type:complete len:136 (-) Transcript_33698:2791-3198(-)
MRTSRPAQCLYDDDWVREVVCEQQKDCFVLSRKHNVDGHKGRERVSLGNTQIRSERSIDRFEFVKRAVFNKMRSSEAIQLTKLNLFVNNKRNALFYGGNMIVIGHTQTQPWEKWGLCVCVCVCVCEKGPNRILLY